MLPPRLAMSVGPVDSPLVARQTALGTARAALCGRWGLPGGGRTTWLHSKLVQIVHLRPVWLDIWCGSSIAVCSRGVCTAHTVWAVLAGWLHLPGATTTVALPSVTAIASCSPNCKCLALGAMLPPRLAMWIGPVATPLVARSTALGTARAALCGRWGLPGGRWPHHHLAALETCADSASAACVARYLVRQ